VKRDESRSSIALNFLDFFEYGAARKDYLAILEQDCLGLRQGSAEQFERL
jgi:hypothetical protein